MDEIHFASEAMEWFDCLEMPWFQPWFHNGAKWVSSMHSMARHLNIGHALPIPTRGCSIGQDSLFFLCSVCLEWRGRKKIKYREFNGGYLATDHWSLTFG